MASLTRMQQAYAAARVRLGARSGAGLEAAREAGYGGNASTLRVTASKLSKHPGVRAEMARLRAAAKAGAIEAPKTPANRKAAVAILTLHRKLELLAAIAEEREAKDSDRIRAIELASRLDGDLGGSGGDVEAVTAAAAQAAASATVVVWVGNARGPAPESSGG